MRQTLPVIKSRCVEVADQQFHGDLGFDWDVVVRLRPEIDAPDPEWPSLLAHIRADTLVLGWGHMVHDAEPDDFAAAVLDHLRRPAG
jgi:hypothetical protein